MNSISVNSYSMTNGGYPRKEKVQPVTSTTATQQEGYQRSSKMKTYEDLMELTKKFALEQLRTGSSLGEVINAFNDTAKEMSSFSDYMYAIQDANRRP
jgi:hypothetical protein